MSTSASPAAADHIEALIQGQVSGQVAVGKNILMVGPVYGGVVNVAPPGESAEARLRPRQRPVRLLPRRPSLFLDREAESATLRQVLDGNTPVDLYGQAGVGKTTLLRHLSHTLDLAAFPDGLVYLSARHLPLDDFLHDLLMAFYESDVAVRLPRTAIRTFLAQVRALILVDDVGWPREDVEILLDMVAQAAVLIAGTQRHLWGNGEALRLQGLPEEAAVALFTQVMGRPLQGEEREQVTALVRAVQGHPLSLQQLAAEVAEGHLTLAEALARARGDREAPERGAAVAAFNALSEEDRRLLSALAALRDVPLDTALLAAAAGVPNAGERLRHLETQGFVESHSPRYTVRENVHAALAGAPTLVAWQTRVVQALLDWIDAHQDDHDQLAALAPTCQAAADWLAGQGRWADILRLARAVDAAISLRGRWGAWHSLLERALQAARALGDRAVEAWALHQLGTRALCLGQANEALAFLREALSLRESLGDAAAAAITRHNLHILGFPPPPPPHEPAPPASPAAAPGGAALPALLAKVLLAAVVVAAIIGAGWWGLRSRTSAPPPANVAVAVSPTLTATPSPSATPTPLSPSPTPTPSATPTPTPTFTSTPTATPTPTVTPTPTATPTVTPTFTPSPVPWVRATIKGECGWQFPVGTDVVLEVQTNTAGSVQIEVWQNNEPIAREVIRVAPDRPAYWPWTFTQPGTVVFTVLLRDRAGTPLAKTECPVFVYAEPTRTPTPTATPLVLVLPPGVLVEEIRAPDLVVDEAGVQAVYSDELGNTLVDLYVRVRNRGTADATTFQVAVAYSTEEIGTRYLVPYTVGEATWFPVVEGPLPPDAFYEIIGTVTLPKTIPEVVYLWVTVDSCTGSEFLPTYCRVNESDETNNEAGPLTIRR